MKRKGDLYKDICNIDNIKKCFEEVCKNTNNKSKVNRFKEYKAIYIYRIYNILINKKYVVGPMNEFTIYEPKERKIISQGMLDKTINHLVSRYILYPTLVPCLLDVNIASRPKMGTKKGIELVKKFHNTMKVKYGKYYVLKCDISKYFASIDKDILKEKVKRKIKDKDALKIVFDIIDAEKEGLSIGLMTSQVFAIFYLNDLDHYIKEELKIKCYLRYQDDFLLFHESKRYLQECFKKIKDFLEKEKLVLNRKSRIFSSNDNFIFLGRNKFGKYSKYRNMNRRIKKRKYLYYSGRISCNSLVGTIINYRHLLEKV